MAAYYNEIDGYAAAWLRNLIAAGHIAPGDVDERSIKEVQADDLRGYDQCHFFAGIGGWSLALRLAGWDDARPVWSGSCPCQPYSAAGKRKGDADERNLWPDFFRLIRECRPPAVLGEQVASAIGHGWLDGISADLEGEGYACGAAVLGAHSVGAPHIRQRLFWVADAQRDTRGPGRTSDEPGSGPEAQGVRAHDEPGRCGDAGRLADADSNGSREGRGDAGEVRGLQEAQREPEHGAAVSGRGGSDGRLEHATGDGRIERRAEPGGRGAAGRCGEGAAGERLGHTLDPRLEGHAGHGDDGHEPGRLDPDEAGSVAAAGDIGGLADNERVRREMALQQPGGGTEAISERQADVGGSCGASLSGAWSDFYLVPCADGKARRVGSGLFPLAHGVPARVGRLRAYGNAIVPQDAVEFIEAWKEATWPAR